MCEKIVLDFKKGKGRKNETPNKGTRRTRNREREREKERAESFPSSLFPAPRNNTR